MHKGTQSPNEDIKINDFVAAIRRQLGVWFSEHAAHEMKTTAGEKRMSEEEYLLRCEFEDRIYIKLLVLSTLLLIPLIKPATVGTHRCFVSKYFWSYLPLLVFSAVEVRVGLFQHAHGVKSNSLRTVVLFERINWYINSRSKSQNVCYWFGKIQRVHVH